MSNEIVKHESRSMLEIFSHDFEQGQRIAKAMVNSLIWQAKFSKDSKGNAYTSDVQLSTAMVVLDISYRLGIGWPEVCQNGSITNGRWTWASEYIAGHVMNSPKYKDFEYLEEVRGKTKTPDPNSQQIENWTCSFVGIRHDGRRDVGSEVSYEMAIADGWWGRGHSKWPRMPRKMLRARAIAFFNREFPTATLLGFKSQEEQEDSSDVHDAVVIEPTEKKQPPKRNPPAFPTTPGTKVKMTTHEVVEVEESTNERKSIMFGEIEVFMTDQGFVTDAEGNPIQDGDYPSGDDPSKVWEVVDGKATLIPAL